VADTVPLPANVRCARCGGPFRCGVADPGPCPCTNLVLPPALLAQIARQYPEGCLCLDCLQVLRDGAVAAAPDA
jgi:hypothetical protein